MTSTIKVDNIQDQDGNNIINENANTITIGASGDTVSLASGASQTGFGRTGTVDWETTVKTASFTATSGEGYFCNTTSSAFTVTLPASPSAGDIVAVKDYAATFATNNLTIGRNSQPIGGVADDLVLSTNQQSITLIYIDGTKGWLATNDSTTNAVPTKFVTATGGTITTCGNFKIHTFTGPGTFCVSCAGNPAGSNTVDYLVVAGGGAGGSGSSGGGGGAGGYRESSGAASGCYTRSPLGACVSALPVSVQGYPIAIGGGGTKGTAAPEDGCTTAGTPGSNSSFSTITSAGGGKGAGGGDCATADNGGAGGGGNGSVTNGNGNTPPVSPPQGVPGRAATTSPSGVAGGGGGALPCGLSKSWVGRDGATSSINGTPTIRATGGGGGKNSSTPIPSDSGPRGGGIGGSSNISGNSGATGPTDGGNAGDNTGSGGGGGGRENSVTSRPGGAGGSGIVIIRYKFQ